MLQSVARRSATIGPSQGAPAVQLDLPPLPAQAAGIEVTDDRGRTVTLTAPPQRVVSLSLPLRRG